MVEIGKLYERQLIFFVKSYVVYKVSMVKMVFIWEEGINQYVMGKWRGLRKGGRLEMKRI